MKKCLGVLLLLFGATVAQATEQVVWTSGELLYYGPASTITLSDQGGGDKVQCPFDFASGGYVNAIPFQGSFPHTDPVSLLAGDIMQDADLYYDDGNGNSSQIASGGIDYQCNGNYSVTRIEITVVPWVDYPGSNDLYYLDIVVWGNPSH